MSRRSSLLLAFFLLVFAPQMSIGQFDPNRLVEMREKLDQDGRWIDLREKGALVFQKSVQEELKLTEEQVAKLKPVLGQVATNELKFNQLRQATAPEETSALNKKLKDYFESVDATMADVFNADQSQRLQQIHLQSLSVLAISRPTVKEALELSPQQRSQAGRLGGDLMRLGMPTRLRTGENQKQNEEAKKKINEQFLGLLNDEQKGKWEKLLGKPFEFRPDEVRSSTVARLAGDRPLGDRPPRPDFSLGTKLEILGKQPLQAELKLTDAQIAIINEAQLETQKMNEEGSKIAVAFEQENRREEMARIYAATAKAHQKALIDNLTAEQSQRLHEIYLQFSGPGLLSESNMTQILAFNEGQLTNARSMQKQLTKEMVEMMRSQSGQTSEEMKQKSKEKYQAARQQQAAQLLELLTAEQRAKWGQMLGKPFPVEQLKDPVRPPSVDQAPPK